MARRVVGAAVAVALCALPATAPAAAPPAPVLCDAVDVSPGFASDGTILCVARNKPRLDAHAIGVHVFLSTDKGRTWQPKAGTGLAHRFDSRWIQVVFSPQYPRDRAIYVQEERDGLYRTTDGGNTFTLVDPLAQPSYVAIPSLTPLLAAPLAGLPGGVGQAPEPAIAHGARRLPAVISPPFRRPVPGSPAGGVAQFLVPAGFPAVPATAVVAVDATPATPWRFELALCTPQLACGDTRLVLGPFFYVIHAGTFTVANKQVILVIARAEIGEGAGTSVAWRSTDGGRTYHQLPKLTALLTGTRTFKAFAAAGPRGSLWLRVSHADRRSRQPWTQLLRSFDAGVTWVRVAANSTREVNTATLPPAGDVPWLHVAADGRVLLIGASEPNFANALYCSTDLRRWRTRC